MTSGKPILLSGMQPTGGGLMLGNYLGALKNWVHLQQQYDCFFAVVDLHAITVRHDPEQLRELSYLMLAVYIAGGVDPDAATLFLQSQVPEHAELSWILTCYAYMGELNRMTQFKDKSEKAKNVGTGLFTYPVLMAADILLYQTNLVPVGHDQKQHLELTRDLAIRMNNLYGNLFTVPEPYIPPVGARIMSLQDPSVKMSKSDADANATIYLSDSEDVIMKKFKRAVTDSVGVINYTDEQPGIKNLISIQAALTGKSPEQIVAAYAGKQYGPLKTETAEIVIASLKPIREKYQKLLQDKKYLDDILRKGARKASERGQLTLKRVKEAMGFIV